jgi:hypothetical protein
MINEKNLMSLYARWLYYIKALTTNKKIVVIESDDWGSIRTSNKEAYDVLLQDGYDMTKSPYTIDALESNEDLTNLYSVLDSVKDSQRNPACFTANMIMANPDFEAIEKNNFSKYVYETVDKTLDKYKGRDKVRDLWKHGMQTKMFFPQLHAREHVRYWDWMNALKENDVEAKKTFKLGMCGVPRVVSKNGTSYFYPPYIDDQILIQEKVDLNQLISEGAELFKSEFGFYSKTTIAPNCGWTSSCEKIWKQNHLKFIQGGYLQEHHYANKTKYIAHYLGEKSKTEGLTYLVRNCTFEPSTSTNPNYWEGTFKQVENAFSRKTPALISSHRVNYIGSVDEKNRENGLRQLYTLLNKITEQYPDVIFLNSFQLGELLVYDKS